MKRLAKFMGVLTAAIAFLLPGRAGAVEPGYTLLVVPDRYSVLQVGFDFLQKRPAIMVAYQGQAATADPTLYAWNGQEWLYVSLKDYREVNFLQRRPARIVLVGDERTLPEALEEASGWAPEKIRVTSLGTADMVNELGRLLAFTPQEWQWFAARYKLNLRDESEPMRKSSWYDQAGPLRRPTLSEVVGPRKQKAAAPPVPPLKEMTESAVEPVAPETTTTEAVEKTPLTVPGPTTPQPPGLAVP